MPLTALPPLPAGLTAPDGRLVRGLFVGDLQQDPVDVGPRHGRVRRWRYAAAGDGRTLVGAAVVDLGFVGAAFAFAVVDGRTATWQARFPLGRGVTSGGTPSAGAAATSRRASVDLRPDGGLRVEVESRAGRLRADVVTTMASQPAVLVTGTPGGGWNATAKAAGTATAGTVTLGDAAPVSLGDTAAGWWDWTVGRQDRRTRWRWAAGGGSASDGRRVGLNVSTGMNGAEAGEDVVWWEGVPYALAVDRLEPVGSDPARAWQLSGPGADLHLDPVGARAADERLLVVRSRYVQPFGTWSGRLPGPDGEATEVTLAGVAEDHHALW